MFQIGSYGFPSHATFCHVRLIEAKSKVRKEIEITSLLNAPSCSAFEECLAALQHSVEAFDRGEAVATITPGRYYLGRRRYFQITPDESNRLAFVKLILFTQDRYERSLVLHQLEIETMYGQAAISVYPLGNWTSEPLLILTPAAPLVSLKIHNLGNVFVLQGKMEAGQAVSVDAENHLVTIGDRNVNVDSNELFPSLKAGRNHMEIEVQPADVQVHCLIQYRDRWI